MSDFQTPQSICDYMVSFLPKDKINSVLEPTPGDGNIVKSLEKLNIKNIIQPLDFWEIQENEKFDWIVMNPPFTPMELGYKILYKCMNMSDNIIALMPWLTMINGEKRTKYIIDYGLKSITHLPRKAFKGSRVQCCILEMKRDYKGEIIFKNYVF